MIFTFIKATAQDADYLLQLRKLTMVEHLENSGLFLTDEEHRERVQDAYHCSHLILNGDLVVGLIKFEELADKVKIMQLQIHPDHQGKGIGRQVIEQIASKVQPKYLELTVLKQNPAQHLYKRLGFSVFGQDDLEYFMHTK